MEKPIEEMAKVLGEIQEFGINRPRDEERYPVLYPSNKEVADYLISKSYRKASDVAREIFAEIFNFLENQQVVTENARLKEVAEWIFHDYLPRKFAELKNKYESEGEK